MLACLLLYYVCFTSYDIYFTTSQQAADNEEEDADSNNENGSSIDEAAFILAQNEIEQAKMKSMYETDPDLVWDDHEQRKRETEDQLSLERQVHKTK